MITSVKNARVKEVRALQARSKKRRDAGVFVVEGVRLVEEVFDAGWEAKFGFFTEDLNERGLALVNTLLEANVPVESVAPHVMKAVSDTQSPQGILLVVEQRNVPFPESAELFLILDKVQDPGNVGTLLRTAAAAGFDAVLLTEGSVDPFSPKVLRAGMGAHFRLAVRLMTDEEIFGLAQVHRLTLWAASVAEGQPYTQADLGSPLAIVIGSEADGITPSLLEVCLPIHIPMPGGGESLNAAAAGAILIFEVIRQRNQ